MQDSIVLVGCGNMGYAMLKGWLDGGIVLPKNAHVVEPNEVLRERAAALGAVAHSSADTLPSDLVPRMILLAVKPQVMAVVVPDYKRFSDLSTFVSVAAGTPVSLFENILGSDAAIIRCMPNTPAAIGKGMLVTYNNKNVTEGNAAFVNRLLEVSGKTANVSEESLMDAVTAVSGSGPAYIFHFIEALTDAGIDAGLPKETAALLAMQTVYGAGALAAKSNDTPTTLREQVTSPNGTTAAALGVLMGENRLKNLLKDAVEAARLRAVELGKS